MLLYAASISRQSDYIISQLVNFMEKEECPSDLEGKYITALLRDYLDGSPNKGHVILKEVMHVYSDRINQLCEQHENN